MIRTGLLSVTFRKLSPREIVKLVASSKLHAIEWGGDIHVRPGDIKTADEVRRMTTEEGISIASYGSYYRVGDESNTPGTFEYVLETAVALGAPSIRVWAGNRGSESADEDWRHIAVQDTVRIAEYSAKHGITIDFEFHGGTLTDSVQSTIRLLEQVNHSNVRCNWQAPVHESPEQRLQGLRQIRPWLANIHVFHWKQTIRRPLIEGIEEWAQYASAIRETGSAHYMMLEFVKDDDPDQFLHDVEVLRSIVQFEK